MLPTQLSCEKPIRRWTTFGAVTHERWTETWSHQVGCVTQLLAWSQSTHASRTAEEVPPGSQSTQLLHPPFLGASVLKPDLEERSRNSHFGITCARIEIVHESVRLTDKRARQTQQSMGEVGFSRLYSKILLCKTVRDARRHEDILDAPSSLVKSEKVTGRAQDHAA
ncbi:hypothetical protein ElyMa_005535900 [Elysia marginata]|uniref:Uncharacterized protein n=1 Tax=Elysia marginata TaxID=1093978 RepID=A0AAV4EX61_9GAST|nr:hypothetical protein ElyMa_005535900 [Elysia marginata]